MYPTKNPPKNPPNTAVYRIARLSALRSRRMSLSSLSIWYEHISLNFSCVVIRGFFLSSPIASFSIVCMLMLFDYMINVLPLPVSRCFCAHASRSPSRISSTYGVVMVGACRALLLFGKYAIVLRIFSMPCCLISRSSASRCALILYNLL